MSIDLEVYLGRQPDDLRELWQDAFAGTGLTCELRPDFNASWEGGDLIAKLTPDARLAKLYGKKPFATGCGMDLYDMSGKDEKAELAEMLDSCPKPLRPKLKKSVAKAFFTTSAGRSTEGLRFQVFAAATLAACTGGLVFDPQSGSYVDGPKALAWAEEQASAFENYEGAPKSKPFVFKSWKAALKASIPEFEG